jgi:hypothetical protein
MRCTIAPARGREPQRVVRIMGNLTGTSLMLTELVPKRFELLSELVPGASMIGLIVNPNKPPSCETRAATHLPWMRYSQLPKRYSRCKPG